MYVVVDIVRQYKMTVSFQILDLTSPPPALNDFRRFLQDRLQHRLCVTMHDAVAFDSSDAVADVVEDLPVKRARVNPILDGSVRVRGSLWDWSEQHAHAVLELLAVAKNKFQYIVEI
jgi:hypothetical protein